MKVKLRNPDREVELAGGRSIHDVLGELGIDPDSVLVIHERELLTRRDRVDEADMIELRPVISGGAPNPMRWILGERLGRPPGDREVAGGLSDEVMPAELYGAGTR